MPARVLTRESSRRTRQDEENLSALTSAVYPPEDVAHWPGRKIDWSPPQWDIEILDEEGIVVSYTGLVIRQAKHEERPVAIAGIGGVKTHPAARWLGYAALGIDSGLGLAADRGCDFALLVCEHGLIPYYQNLGWDLFEGTTLTVQRGSKTPFDFNRVMVKPLGTRAPRIGTIDLEGPPW